MTAGKISSIISLIMYVSMLSIPLDLLFLRPEIISLTVSGLTASKENTVFLFFHHFFKSFQRVICLSGEIFLYFDHFSHKIVVHYVS